MKNGQLNSAGFTLIELMVVIFIMTTLISITLVYSRSGERYIILFREQAAFIGALNRAKSFALSTVQAQGTTRQTCGYGVHIVDSSHYELVRILKSAVDCKELSSAAHDLNSFGSFLVTAYTLQSPISLGPKISGSFYYAIFIPPYQSVRFFNSDRTTINNAASARTFFCVDNKLGSGAILVNRFGQVSTETVSVSNQTCS